MFHEKVKWPSEMDKTNDQRTTPIPITPPFETGKSWMEGRRWLKRGEQCQGAGGKVVTNKTRLSVQLPTGPGCLSSYQQDQVVCPVTNRTRLSVQLPTEPGCLSSYQQDQVVCPVTNRTKLSVQLLAGPGCLSFRGSGV
ncbi:hypothetical protein Btru_021791 [Bulinus truncatus]|nr:hypothetical protein Btru_021791 [Bulinus truncatus]